MNFFERLYNLADFLLKVGLKKLLAGAGLGIVTGGIFLVVFNYYVQQFVTTFQMVDNEYLPLLGLLGIDKAASIIIGAYAVRLGILATIKIGIGRTT